MTILRKTISLLAVFSIIPAAWAVTARPGAISATSGALTATAANGASRRLPVSTGYRLLSGNIVGTATTAPATTTSSSSSVASLDDVECVEEYTSCITGEDACGSDFEECTTNVLFHAQMPDCTSTLMQCTPNGIANLFGINNINNLSAAASTDEDGRITEFVYPTADSIIGQKIIAAEIDNRYSTEQCARNYTRCLERDDVCGANFELCTSAKEFKRQALYCDSKLARCQAEGVKHMFGSAERYATIDDVKETKIKGGIIADRISAGADYVANNALDACYKVVDNCFAKACTANPFRCLEGTSVGKLKNAQMVSDGGNGSGEIELNNLYGGDETAKLNSSQINRYLRTSCADTIGLNASCQMIVNGKKATAKQLKDQDEKEDIIDTVYAGMYNDRLSRIQSIVQGLAQEFDSNAKQKCVDTIQECAIRSCGGGSGAACYKKVMSGTGETKSIAVGTAYSDIKTGCSAAVNSNPYCLYAKSAAGESDSTVYSYSFTSDDAFSTLVPDHSSGTNAGDPIGAVATINAALFSTYNEAGLARMKNECASAARGCVKALCGKDYESCYRNRTDVYSSITETDSVAYDNSMNKVGGVLDYTIILGLCADTVKNNDSCQEHLAIEKINIVNDAENTTAQWGGASSVRSGWYDAGKGQKEIYTQQVQAKDENGNLLCTNSHGETGICYTANSNNELYSEPLMQSFETYRDTAATNTLFKELVQDMEKEAQGIYNAKLTKLQNMCIGSNNGGIMGAKDMSAAYKWVKLSGKKIPENYTSFGLQDKDIKASNDLYGSFCAVRVSLYSEDQTIRDALNGVLKERNEDLYEGRYSDGANISLSNSRYFAVGDPIVCGGWLTGAEIEKIASVVEAKAREQKKDEQPKNMRGWMTTLGALGLGTGGMFLGDAIEKGTVGSSFTGIANTKKKGEQNGKLMKECQGYIQKAVSAVSKDGKGYDNIDKVSDYINKANESLASANVDTIDFDDVGYNAWKSAVDAYCETKNGDKCTKYKEATDGTASTAASTLRENLGKAKNDLCIAAIKESCGEGYKYDEEKKECVKEKNETEWKGKVSGAIVGAVGGGVLGYTITDAILDAQLDKAGNEAYKAFMDAIGSKIECRIGSEMVGSYGQIIETSME